MSDEDRRDRRERARRRRDRSSAADHDGPSLTVSLPGWRVSGRAVLLVLFVVAGLATGALLWVGVPSFWMVPAGFGLVIGGALFSETDPPLTGLEGDPEASTVTVLRHGAAPVVLLRSALEAAQVTSHTSSSSSGGGTSTSYGVALRKLDGGQLALAQTGGDRGVAEALAADVDAMLAAVPASEEREDDLVRQAERRLRDHPRVELTMEDEVGDGYRGRSQRVLQVSWSLRSSLGRAAVLPVVLAGMVIAISGMVQASSTVALVAMAVALVLGLILYLRSATRTMRVRVDDEYLRILTGRGSEVDEKALPLAAIDAIDLAWTGPLLVRVDEANEEIRALMSKAEGGGLRGVGVFAILRGIIALMRKTIHIDTGALPFELRLDLEVLLGAEVARRSDREVGVL